MLVMMGAGSERPGVTSIDGTTGLITQTHRFDQLPSNTITALASDWWGLHIATDVGPMTHWNGINNQFEDGAAAFQVPSWPVERLVSNGDELLAIGRDIITISEATTQSHSVTKVSLFLMLLSPVGQLAMIICGLLQMMMVCLVG